MGIFETIIRVMAVMLLSAPYYRLNAALAQIKEEKDSRRKFFMVFIGIHILLYAFVLQIWIIYPVMSNAMG